MKRPRLFQKKSAYSITFDEADLEKFRRYLLGELFWELERFEMTILGLSDFPRDEIVMLGNEKYDILRFKCGDEVFEARLSWRGDVPPSVSKVD